MKKIINFLLVFIMLFTIISVNPLTTSAARVNTCYPYTLGEQVEYSYTTMTEYHKFEITNRSRIKVEMCVPQEQQATYNGDVDFYFERKADGETEDVASSKYYDFTDKFSVDRGTSQEKEITLQPGKYYFVVSQSSLCKYTYQFRLSVLEETATPTYSDVVKNGTSYDVDYKVGTEFRAHNYQYERSTMYFYFTVPYRTQFDFSLMVDKDEYFDNYTYKHYDSIKVQRDINSTYNTYSDLYSYVANPGEKLEKTFTLDAGEYRIEMKSNNGSRGDFTLKLNKGSLEATAIKYKNKTTTIERGVSTYILPTATPENGTASITYKSSNTKIATVNKNGWVTGVKHGTATITAALQNGKKATIKVTVKEMRAVAEVVDQRSFYAYHNKNEVYLSFTPYKDTYKDATYISDLNIDKVKRTFKVYRSTKKNGTYKYMGSVSCKKYSGYLEFVDKKVKANSRYYYKVQVKIHGDGDYGPMSKAMEYWTAPDPKVKIKSNTLSKASWKKVKSTTGYLVTEHCIQFAGYNVFGQELRDSITSAKLVKSTSFKKKYQYISKSGKKSKSDLSVTTYGKHGKYYYVSGKLITKYTSNLEILKVNRIVG